MSLDKSIGDFTYPSKEVSQNPYEFYTLLRDGEPVYRVPETGDYLISRYDLCAEVLRNTRDFSSVRPWEKPTHPDAVALLREKGWPQHHLLSGNDPPEHTRLRRIAKQAFTRRRIEQLELRSREFARDLVDGLVDKGSIEFVSSYAELLPLYVICEMLGVQDADIGKIRHWSDSIVELTAGAVSVQREIELTQELVDFQHFLNDQIARWHKEPVDGFLGDMITARDDAGEGLDVPNLIDMFRLLLAAGHETTMQFIGNAFFLLLSQPGAVERLKGTPAAMKNFIEEVLRYESAVTRIHRVAARDVDFHGVLIPKGARVLPMIAAANRDGQRFGCPAEFKADRLDADAHLAFGWGMHMCLGAPLARVEVLVSLETLLARLPNLRLQEGRNTFEYRNLATRRGLREFYVEWDVPS
jgi:cytochrome P450